MQRARVVPPYMLPLEGLTEAQKESLMNMIREFRRENNAALVVGRMSGMLKLAMVFDTVRSLHDLLVDQYENVWLAQPTVVALDERAAVRAWRTSDHAPLNNACTLVESDVGAPLRDTVTYKALLANWQDNTEAAQVTWIGTKTWLQETVDALLHDKRGLLHKYKGFTCGHLHLNGAHTECFDRDISEIGKNDLRFSMAFQQRSAKVIVLYETACGGERVDMARHHFRSASIERLGLIDIPYTATSTLDWRVNSPHRRNVGERAFIYYTEAQVNKLISDYRRESALFASALLMMSQRRMKNAKRQRDIEQVAQGAVPSSRRLRLRLESVDQHIKDIETFIAPDERWAIDRHALVQEDDASYLPAGDDNESDNDNE